ncbi:MAG TPA: CPBP family intramembrane glutamic endopeptidase [Xanthomonadaceae bacterium]|jgi:hypothetical protein
MEETVPTRLQPAVPRTITLGRQILVCAAMCAAAVLIIALWFPHAAVATLSAGLSLPWQVATGLLIGSALAVGTLLETRRANQGASTRRTAANYGRLDLRGWNPLWFALLAGFGEESLFRGALQPLVGLWIASLLFVLAHARAYRFRTFDRTTLAQAFGLFATSVALGLLARFAGLPTAMIVHAAIDAAGLYAIRRMASMQQLREST